MMKYIHSTMLLAGALVFSACAPLPRTVAFDESAFAHYGRSGSATIIGTAYTVLRDNNQRVATHFATVKLMPANAYTDEMAQKKFEGGRKMVPADPRFAKYVRKTHPDDDGNFAFHNVPAGNYYVGCHLHWTYETTSVDADGNFWPEEAETGQWIYTKVSIKNGETVKVDSWNQGS